MCYLLFSGEIKLMKKKTGYRPTEQWTNATDRRTDRRTDTNSYRDARTHLKTGTPVWWVVWYRKKSLISEINKIELFRYTSLKTCRNRRKHLEEKMANSDFSWGGNASIVLIFMAISHPATQHLLIHCLVHIFLGIPTMYLQVHN